MSCSTINNCQCNYFVKLFGDNGKINFINKSKYLLRNSTLNFQVEKIMSLRMTDIRSFVHSVTLKKTLFEASQNYMPNREEINELKLKYSGYLTYLISYNSYYLVIFPNQIRSDDILVDISNDVRFTSLIKDEESEEKFDLDDSQLDLLTRWADGADDPEEITTGFLNLFGEQPIRDDGIKEYKLYRGLNWDTEEDLNNFIRDCNQSRILNRENIISSWTPFVCIAASFASTSDYGVIITNTFDSEDILIDMGVISEESGDKFGYDIYDQGEIIVKPGKYPCSINTLVKNRKLYYPNGIEIGPIFLN